ncbi:MAG TPA: hypothetical protein VHY31_19460 [Streptosporangiaceae bacterium]|nr:hypothetical protein [Streptosporangiaceae bacterium]
MISRVAGTPAWRPPSTSQRASSISRRSSGCRPPSTPNCAICCGWRWDPAMADLAQARVQAARILRSAELD